MGKWRLKGCPRCNGDLWIGEELEGEFENCLQCGYLHFFRNMAEPEKPDTIVLKEAITLEHSVIMK